ncbi:cyclic nucleotide-binding domain-containing protein [Variovorax sp. PCZ-1]|uniref:cyclic nucleotide-binding domain-containing protein n=1 Tax=Variovorax sp. PCZ-1 TaxID=2835533 RepID=UPI001BD17AA5|nr:cyclic nucleotide-binding domain-containing protein [Variovorax sp. PCZ-1]MBS7806270.1 cyclic nucleotide-binding domain-containing protein [Variovorax sp. PCZ-1]
MHTNLGELHNISEKDAAHLLVTESALGQLGFKDAQRVVRYMKPKRIKAGGALIREGEKVHNDFMMLILSGDVRVESLSAGAAEEVVVTVMGAGSLIGEMGMINDTARSATCIASTELAVAVLSRASMKKMMAEEAELASRFLLAISSRLAERLRDTTTKLKKFIQLNAMLQKEVYALMDGQSAKQKLSRSEMPTEQMALETRPVALMEAYISPAKARSLARKA